MRRLPPLALVLLLPALALLVWAGSLISAPARPEGNTNAPATPTVAATTRSVARVEQATPSASTRSAPATSTRVPAPPTTALAAPTDSPVPPTLPPTPQPSPTATLPPPPTSTPMLPPPPSNNRIGGPVTVPNNHEGQRWVTLQVGHLNNIQLPSELAHLHGNSGAHSEGVNEVDINFAVAQAAAALLEERGFKVDLLDSTIPVDYVTDLFIAVHADGNIRPSWRGFKAVAPWNAGPDSDQFVGLFYEEYGKATGLPADPFTSVAMADYYAFNPDIYNHAVSREVPAAILELGFVTNPLDRVFLTSQIGVVALGITNAVDRWFHSGAAGATPSPYPSFTSTPTATPTSTSTPTPTSTATSTPTSTATPTTTPTNTVTTVSKPITFTIVLAPTSTQEPTTTLTAPPTSSPTATSTPLPTVTEQLGVLTSDGRWLPALSPNGRDLPPPGSDAAPVLLSIAADSLYIGTDGRERRQVWYQYYEPSLGRSVWRKGDLLLVRP